MLVLSVSKTQGGFSPINASPSGYTTDDVSFETVPVRPRAPLKVQCLSAQDIGRAEFTWTSRLRLWDTPLGRTGQTRHRAHTGAGRRSLPEWDFVRKARSGRGRGGVRRGPRFPSRRRRHRSQTSEPVPASRPLVSGVFIMADTRAFIIFSETLASASWLLRETACATCFALKSAVEGYGSSDCARHRRRCWRPRGAWD